MSYRICHMTSAHLPGDSRIFHRECVSLAKAGYETFLVEQGESYTSQGIQVIGTGEVPSNRLSRMLTMTKRVYEAALEIDADLYHIHDPELLPYGRKLKKKGKIVVFDAHEDTLESIWEKEWIPTPARRLVYHWFKTMQARNCAEFDALISVTPHLVAFYKQLNPQSFLVTNYPPLQEEITLPNFEQRTIVFAGGIDRQWNHHIVLEALEGIDDCRYCLCGFENPEYLEELKALPAWKKTDFHGAVSFDEVLSYLASGSVGIALVSYSRNTDGKNGTMGNTKVFEEMAAALPVICTDFTLWQEFIERYDCGICVDPNDVQAVKEALIFLLDNPKEAQRMGQNGRRAAEQEFNWQHEANTLLALYKSLLRP